MPPRKPITRFKSILRGTASPAEKAAAVIALEPELPDEAIAFMDEVMDRVDPLVQVALMDTYFEMTGDRYHEQDLIRMLDAAAALADAGEELYMAARLALGRMSGRPADRFDDLLGEGFEVAAVRRRRGVRRPRAGSEITIIVHGTWASDGKWWRPRGDFFEYVRTDLERDDLYAGSDLFIWSGKNKDTARRRASKSLDAWLRSHPADEVNVFAHSHGANVAMLSTHEGTTFDRLVMLSPPVRRDYFADWSRVGAAYNIQAAVDPVVAIARGGQWFKLPQVAELKLKAHGHGKSHDPDTWRDENVAAFVGLPW